MKGEGSFRAKPGAKPFLGTVGERHIEGEERDAAFESPDFWRALARLVPRLADGSVFVHANGARDAFDPGRAPLSIRVARATWRRVIETQLQRTAQLSR